MKMPDAAKLEGAISGRALYDGRIDPALEALGFGILNGLTSGVRWPAAKFSFARQEDLERRPSDDPENPASSPASTSRTAASSKASTSSI
jgi:hypothetical protein